MAPSTAWTMLDCRTSRATVGYGAEASGTATIQATNSAPSTRAAPEALVDVPGGMPGDLSAAPARPATPRELAEERAQQQTPTATGTSAMPLATPGRSVGDLRPDQAPETNPVSENSPTTNPFRKPATP
jgi:hypothetical protein